MQASVSESCVGCGACSGICPVVFRMGEDGLAHGGQVPPNQEGPAQEARDGCPVGAISLAE